MVALEDTSDAQTWDGTTLPAPNVIWTPDVAAGDTACTVLMLPNGDQLTYDQTTKTYNSVTNPIKVEPWWNNSNRKPSTSLGGQIYHLGAANIGTGYSTKGIYNLTVGRKDTSTAYYNIITGYGNKASGSMNILSGSGLNVSGIRNVVSGINNTVSGSYSHVSGISSTVTGHYSSVSGGFHPSVAAQYSIVGGRSNTAGGFYNIVGGLLNDVSSSYHAVGGRTHTVSGNYNAVFGTDCTVSGSSCITAGANNTIDGGVGNIALGYINTVGPGANYGVAIGRNLTVTGLYGMAIGNGGSAGAAQFNARFPQGFRLETNSAGTIGMTLGASGTSWASISDRRAKNSIQNLGYGLKTVMSLRPTQYKYNGKSSTSIGFIAQEVQALVPEVVSQTTMGPDGDYLGINYTELIPVLTKAIQEQQVQMEAQQAQIEELKSQVQELQARK